MWEGRRGAEDGFFYDIDYRVLLVYCRWFESFEDNFEGYSFFREVY